MTVTVRFGKKVRVKSTFQIKHRLLLWWLKNQTAKEASEAATQASKPAPVSCPTEAASVHLSSMGFSNSTHRHGFTRLHAHIVEEDSAFTVRVRMLNHLNQHQSCWGEEIAPTFDIASRMIKKSLASQFSIPQSCISIKIIMHRFKDGTLH